MLKNFKIYTKMMEVLLWLFQKINSFPKKQRFVLGQQLENTGLEILKLTIHANNEKNISTNEDAFIGPLNGNGIPPADTHCLQCTRL